MSTLSVLITIYSGTNAAELAVALQSLAVQTRPADEVVIVFDGPVAEDVEHVATGFASTQSARLIRLPVNRGSGPASQAGLETIESDFTARLDSDDAARPERFERQLAYLEARPEVAALGTAVEEFEHSLGDATRIRSLPHNPAQYAKMNSPINNPSVMFRTEAAKSVGGYRDVPFMEDYDLWARMLAADWQLRNLSEPLTYLRVTKAQQRRRAASKTRRAERTMQRNLVSYGLISRPRALFNLVARNVYRLLPIGVVKRVNNVLFHRGR